LFYIKLACVNSFFFKKKLRRFLYYIDKNTKEGIKRRERVYNNDEYVEEAAPLSAPDWTKLGYDGLLKNAAIEAVSKYR
jgi:hypothetical protein